MVKGEIQGGDHIKYWMALSTKENWLIVREKGVWGVTDRLVKLLVGAKVGDRMYFYQSKSPLEKKLLPSIIGIGTIASEIYLDKTRIFNIAHAWNMGELFPNRVKLKEIEFIEPVPFKPLTESLNFIKNKFYWNIHLQGRAMIPLSKHDQGIIQKATGLK